MSARSVLACGLLLGALACGDSGAARRAGVVGDWSLRLALDSPGSRHAAPSGHLTHAPLWLDSVPGVSAYGGVRSGLGAGRGGTGIVDIGPLFADGCAEGSAARCAPPDTAGEVEYWVRGDSLVLRTAPRTDHGGIVLEGSWSGDFAAGRWYEPVSGGAVGQFTMRRTK